MSRTNISTFTYQLDDWSSFVSPSAYKEEHFQKPQVHQSQYSSTSVFAVFHKMSAGPSHQMSVSGPGGEELQKKASAGIFCCNVNSYYFKAVQKLIAYISISVELSCPKTF